MPAIELLAIANHAEALNGLLYLSGAGWTVVTRSYVLGTEPAPVHFGIGVAVVVEWTETNRPHTLRLRLEGEDGGAPLLEAEGVLEVGRPTGIPEGFPQRAVLAATGQVAFPGPGGYRLVAELAGGERRQVSFFVRDEVQPLPAVPYTPGGPQG